MFLIWTSAEVLSNAVAEGRIARAGRISDREKFLKCILHWDDRRIGGETIDRMIVSLNLPHYLLGALYISLNTGIGRPTPQLWHATC